MTALSAPDNQNRPPVTVNSKGLFSSRTNEWATPQFLFDALQAEFNFDVDVAARRSNAKCKIFFTKRQNGLTKDWFASSQTKNIYCNPPFQGQTAKWVEKAYQESLKGCTVVVLIPFRSDTSYIHDFVIGKASEIRLIKGRLKYNDGDGSAPFPSSIIVFRPNEHHTQWISVDKENNELSGVISFKPEITYNDTRTYKSGKKAPNGIELRFGNVRPTEQVRELLKKHGFQFSEKQKIWYAIDNALSRECINYIENNDIEADDTQYEKRHFWTSIHSIDFYNKLTNYTEFMVSETAPQFYYNKKQLESKVNVQAVIYGKQLKFKKFYNKIVGEDGEDSEEEGQEAENETAITETIEEENPIPSKPIVTIDKPDIQLAQKLKELADGMQKQIDAKLHSATSRQRPTAKRLRVASGMRQDGYYLQNIQKVLYALSKAHHTGQIQNFDLLKHIRTKSQVELINKFTDVYGKQHEAHYLQSVFNNQLSVFKSLGIKDVLTWSLANVQREQLLHQFSDRVTEQQTERQRQMEELEISIKSKKIDGFFPTPKKLIDELIGIAEIKTGESVLEPSSGKGDILDALQTKYGDSIVLSACEVNNHLRELLTLKGYDLAGTNFLLHTGSYDKIIMNPPFEKGQDIDHVLHAYSILNKGGRLVSIMSEGVFFRKFKKEKEFRDFLFQTNAFISNKIEEAFKDAFNQTGIAVRIVAINKNHRQIDLDTDIDNENFDDENEEVEDTEYTYTEKELEALAELEILKMELELKLKNKNKNNSTELKGLDSQNIYPNVWNIH